MSFKEIISKDLFRYSGQSGIIVCKKFWFLPMPSQEEVPKK